MLGVGSGLCLIGVIRGSSLDAGESLYISRVLLLLLAVSLLSVSLDPALFCSWLVGSVDNVAEVSTALCNGTWVECNCLRFLWYLEPFRVLTTYDLGDWCLYSTVAGSHFLPFYIRITSPV